MKKLKLDLDQIQVVSFTMETTKGSRGTVNGFAPSTGVGRSPTDYGVSCLYCDPEPISVGSNGC